MTQARETIAVYTEQTVQTYGFYVETGLTLVKLTHEAAALDVRGVLQQAGVRPRRLRLTTARGQPNGALQLRLVLETEPSPEGGETPQAGRGPAYHGPADHGPADHGPADHGPADHGPAATTATQPHRTRVRAPVELVSFQGPHFGDRYGIASRVVDALQSARIELLAMSCASASIHLVVGEGQGQAAVDHLRGPFGGPRGREAPPGEADTP